MKVLGALAMIDDGELDWKVIAISSTDPLAAKLNDVKDVEKECPGTISGNSSNNSRYRAIYYLLV